MYQPTPIDLTIEALTNGERDPNLLVSHLRRHCTNFMSYVKTVEELFQQPIAIDLIKIIVSESAGYEIEQLLFNIFKNVSKWPDRSVILLMLQPQNINQPRLAMANNHQQPEVFNYSFALIDTLLNSSEYSEDGIWLLIQMRKMGLDLRISRLYLRPLDRTNMSMYSAIYSIFHADWDLRWTIIQARYSEQYTTLGGFLKHAPIGILQETIKYI